MEQNQQANEFFEMMNNTQGQQTQGFSQKETVKYPSYSTNSGAESFINVLAIILLILGCLGGIALIINGADSRYGGEMLIAGGCILILSSLIQWAFLNVLVNISRNLFNINAFLRARFGDK